MAIIYTYPVKSTANDNDLILISDSQDSNKTKQIKIGDLPGGSSSGVSSVTATLPVVSSGGNTPVISLKDLTGFGTAGQVIKVNSGADGLEWGAAGGSTLPGGSDHSVQYKNGSAFAGGNDLTFHPTNNIFSVKHTVIVKGQGNGNPAGRLKLNCEQDSHAITLEGPAHSGGADYTLKFPSAAPANEQVLQYTTSGNLGWINTPASTAPQGSDGQFQYKNGSSFAGTDTLRFDADKIHIGKGGGTPTRGQLVMYGDGTNASDIQLYNSGNNRFLKIAQQAGATQDLTLTFPGVAPGGNNKILESDSSGQLSWIPTPSGSSVSITADNASTDYVDIQVNPDPITGTGSIMADLNAVDGTSDTSTKFLSKDNTWDVPSYTTNTNIANSNLQLDNNRNLDLSNGNAADYGLTFISTLGGVSKNLFKFDQIGGTSPRFTVGHTESAYEGYIVLEGNGSNRTGILRFENAAGTYYTSIKAPTTFGANSNIAYTLPNLQGSSNSVLSNNGSGTLSWTTTSEPTEITSSTAVNSTTFANTPFTFANTNGGSGIGAPVAVQVASQYGNKHISFYLGTTFSGGINQSGSNTVNYATSSDYRLKENVVEMTGAVNRVKQLNPSRFNFIADGPSRTVDGFLAHEVSNIVPEAITGSKDAVDAEGNIIPQGIDQSKLVPLLVGAIKELTARIEALEA